MLRAVSYSILQGFLLGLEKLLHKMTLPIKKSGSALRKKRIKQTWKHLRQNRNETAMKKKTTTWMEIRELQTKISV
jgi:hypothetical protein